MTLANAVAAVSSTRGLLSNWQMGQTLYATLCQMGVGLAHSVVALCASLCSGHFKAVLATIVQGVLLTQLGSPAHAHGRVGAGLVKGLCHAMLPE
jgi:hypothetical protein